MDKLNKQPSLVRRRLIGVIGVTTVAGAALPETWVKPVVDSVILPGHAMTTDVTATGVPPEIKCNDTWTKNDVRLDIDCEAGIAHICNISKSEVCGISYVIECKVFECKTKHKKGVQSCATSSSYNKNPPKPPKPPKPQCSGNSGYVERLAPGNCTSFKLSGDVTKSAASNNLGCEKPISWCVKYTIEILNKSGVVLEGDCKAEL